MPVFFLAELDQTMCGSSVRFPCTTYKMKRSVLVTDGEQRAALAIVRSLGAAGYRCVVAAAERRSLAGASRYASQHIAVPDPQSEPVGYAAAIKTFLDENPVELLIPVTEASLLALLPIADQVAARIPFPPLERFQAICDKARVLEVAASLGIRVPRQQELRSSADLPELRPPLVLKPSRSVVTEQDGRRHKLGVKWGRTSAEVRKALVSYSNAAYPVLAQEVISGPGIGVFVLLLGGRLLASFAHRRLREKPPSGGVSVIRQSEPMDPELLDRSLALLERFDWEGVAMVEFKRDETTGEPVLMEINGRFWGSLQLAIDAGVDFPRLLADATLGKPVEAVTTYAFVRNRWFWGDMDHLIARWKEDRAGLAGRVAALAAWVGAFGPRYRSEVFRWTDLRPFARETLHWIVDVTHR